MSDPHPIVRPAGARAAASWPGRKYGDWTVIKALGYLDGGSCLYVLARCECGKKSRMPSSNLLTGISARCAKCGKLRQGTNARVKKVQRLHRAGRSVIGRRGNLYLLACLDCGAPTCRQRCSPCAHVVRADAMRGVPRSGNPETFQSVGERFGVSKQRVQQVVAARGWAGMLAYFEERKARVSL